MRLVGSPTISLCVAAATTVGLISSCQLIAGIDDVDRGSISPGDAASVVGDGPPLFGDAASVRTDESWPTGLSACGKCAAAQCGMAADKCASQSSCKELEGCLFACNGDPCRSQCTIDHPLLPPFDDPEGGVDTVAGNLDACLASQCPSECSLTCGGLSLIADPAEASGCAQCLQANNDYCSSATSCGTDTGCQTYLHCRQGCVTGDCIGYCWDTYQVSSTLFFDFYKPLNAGKCSVECDVGRDWSCIDKPFMWPTVQADPRQLKFWLKNLQGMPLPNVSVKMCDGDKPNCETLIDPVMPAPPVVTDTMGSATLTDWTRNSNHFGLNGYLYPQSLDSQSPAVLPAMIYWGFPLVAIKGVIADPIPLFTTADSVLTAVILNPASGAVAAVALDCFGQPAPDVVLSLSGLDGGAGPLPYYTVDGTISLVTSPTDSTDNSGIGIFPNVPPGAMTVVATPNRSGTPSTPSSRSNVLVVAGTITYVALAPTPPD